MTAAQRKTVWSLAILAGVIFAAWKAWPWLKSKLGGSSSGSSGSGAVGGDGGYYGADDEEEGVGSSESQLASFLTALSQMIGGSSSGLKLGGNLGSSASLGSPLSAAASPYAGYSAFTNDVQLANSDLEDAAPGIIDADNAQIDQNDSTGMSIPLEQTQNLDLTGTPISAAPDDSGSVDLSAPTDPYLTGDFSDGGDSGGSNLAPDNNVNFVYDDGSGDD